MPSASVEYTSTHPPAHYSLAFEPYLYNQGSFLQLKKYEVQSFYAVDHKKKAIVARIHFAVEASPDGSLCAISLPQLPFGSLEYSVDMTLAQLSNFVAFVCDQLAQRGVTSVEIRDCISAYRVDEAKLLHQVLPEQGFSVREKAINHHISVDEKPFSEKIHRMEAKRLRKCHRHGFTFRQESSEKLKDIYFFLSNCRAERGWQLSMNLNDLQKAVTASKETYCFFSIYESDKRIAASLIVNVNHCISYDFYHDALQSYNAYSPTVLLLEGLYNFCQREKIKLLDLGTSASSGTSVFKGHVGGKIARKLTFQINL